MATGALTHRDLQLRDRVMEQLAWDSQVDASGIGVTAHDGVTTLTGFVESYAEKLFAERAAKRVWGIRAVANDIQVRRRLPRTDEDIASDAARALSSRGVRPAVQAVVRSGHITLTGMVPTLFEKRHAEQAVRHINGTLGIVNRILVTPTATPRDVERDIVRALHRDADTKARAIHVRVNGHTVVLTGTVESWHERDAAERAAVHAPGVAHVENLLGIAPNPAEDLDRVDNDTC